MPSPANSNSPWSLRLRLLLSGGVFIIVALASVGYAIERAFIEAQKHAIHQRLEVYYYHLLGILEVAEDGSLAFSSEINDPELNVPGSGLYMRVRTASDVWQSVSALGVSLPPVPAAEPGSSRFSGPGEGSPWYQLINAVIWELDSGAEVDVVVMVLEDPALAERVITGFRGSLLRWLGAAALLVFLAQWLMIRWSLSPLAAISARVAAIEAGRDTRLRGAVPKELAPLAENINMLLASEERNRKQYRHDLDALAHGLKTPLAIIRASLESSGGDDPQIRAALDDMQALVSRHLEAARKSTRKLHAERVDVTAQAQRLIRSLQTIYPQVAIESRLEPGLVFRGDPRDLLEILGNLLDNACKYGRGKVRLTTSGGVPGLRLVVEDNGPGLSRRQLGSLSRRGVRGDEQGTAGSSGHGLGLSIVRHLVDSYKGELRIKPSPLGGARITITLPELRSRGSRLGII